MSFLCKYKNLFGEPSQGLHKYKIFGIAIIDVLATVLLAWISHNYIYNQYSTFVWFIIWVLISIPVHKLFCVKTFLVNS